jgi:hypothetical protein
LDDEIIARVRTSTCKPSKKVTTTSSATKKVVVSKAVKESSRGARTRLPRFDNGRRLASRNNQANISCFFFFFFLHAWLHQETTRQTLAGFFFSSHAWLCEWCIKLPLVHALALSIEVHSAW